MSYDCRGCGESFETLSRKRLHDCSAGVKYGGEKPDEEADVSGMPVDEMTERAVDGVLQCDVCGEKNQGVDDLDRQITSEGVSLAVYFDCEYCGAYNENSATLE